MRLRPYKVKKKPKTNPNRMLRIIDRQEQVIGQLIEGMIGIRVEQKPDILSKNLWNKTN